MKIAIDARELLGQPTGVGRYLSGLLGGWASLPEAGEHEFVLCVPALVDVPAARRPRVDVVVAPGRGTRWEQAVLPGLVRRSGADVLFAPGYTAPLRCSVPTVVAIHDVSFWAHPGWFASREGLRRRWLTRWSAARAARVVTISEFSKAEIVRHLGLTAARVEVTYPGVTEPVRPQSSEPSPMVLYVGSLFTRRHIPELIDAFGRVARHRPGTRLEIVGDNRTTPRIDPPALAERAGVGDRCRIRSYVADAELAGLYGTAGVFVFLSDYEGFGLTPLEALAAGVPVLVLDTPVAREVYGEAAHFLPSPDPARVAAAIEQLLGDTAERARILAAAPDVLSRYSWPSCARRTLSVLLDAARP
jgi:glycosyltransferase involved in cell wall biosynthesis